MTLADYYKQLKADVPPKKAFINKIAERCGVETYTVRVWISGKSRPSQQKYLDILSEETGINQNDLFDEKL